MHKVMIYREDGQKIEVSDLTFEQVKELAGVNGHGAHAPAQAPMTMPRLRRRRTLGTGLIIETSGSDIHGFITAITESDRAQAFITALRAHPTGIDAHTLAPRMGMKDARQIGGFTGGGLAKIAKKYGIKMKDIYTTDVTFPDKKRTRMFYPGKLIKSGAI